MSKLENPEEVAKHTMLRLPWPALFRVKLLHSNSQQLPSASATKTLTRGNRDGKVQYLMLKRHWVGKVGYGMEAMQKDQ